MIDARPAVRYTNSLPRASRSEHRIVSRGYAVVTGGGHLDDLWLFFSHLEPAYAYGRAARMSEFITSWDVFPAAFETQFDAARGTDTEHLLVDDRTSLRDRGDGLLAAWVKNVRSDSSHWVTA